MASKAASSAASAAVTAPASVLKVTQMRSAIGLPQRTRDVLASLGLRKRGKVVFKKAGDQSAAGMIFKVKELVKVEEVPLVAATASGSQVQQQQQQQQQQQHQQEEVSGSGVLAAVGNLTRIPQPGTSTNKEELRRERSTWGGGREGFWIEKRARSGEVAR